MRARMHTFAHLPLDKPGARRYSARPLNPEPMMKPAPASFAMFASAVAALAGAWRRARGISAIRNGIEERAGRANHKLN